MIDIHSVERDELDSIIVVEVLRFFDDLSRSIGLLITKTINNMWLISRLKV